MAMTGSAVAQALPPGGQTNAADPKQLETITVTGQPPMPTSSGSVLAADEQALRHVTSAADLTAIALNFSVFQGTSDRQPQFSSRGLRDNNLAVGEAQGVVYLDDVPYDDMLTWELGEAFELTGGRRFDYARRHSDGQESDAVGGVIIAPPINNDATDNFQSVLPKFELAWKPLATTRIWIGATRGFQPGGFSFSAAPAPTSFAEADSWHFELGARQTADDGTWSLRSTHFYTDIHNDQDFRPTGLGGFAMLNADQAHTLGAELEALARPAEHWDLGLRGGFVSAKFDDFTDPNTGASYDDNTINFVPEYTVDGTVTWRPDQHWFRQAGGQFLGPSWYDESNTTKQGAYALLNARVGWQNKHWGCAGFSRNLLDKQYVATAIHLTQPGLGDFFVVAPGEPATFGVELFAKF